MNDRIIGFDAKRIVSNGTGLGSYGRTLINSLSKEMSDWQLRLYAPDEGRDDLRGQIELSPNVKFVYPKHGSLRVLRDYWRSCGIIQSLKRDCVDLYHGLSGELPHGLHKSEIRGIVTIHDLIFLRHPEYYHLIDAKIYERKFHSTLREADRIIAISECTKRDILAFSDFPADRIDVVYQSCSPRFSSDISVEESERVRSKYGLPSRYVLNVGTVEERKNILLAVKALPLLPDDVKIVVVGRQTKYALHVMEYAKKQSLEDRVLMLQDVPDADLAAIYHLARCFAYPSRYEGFGIPIIEAAMSGLPVVAASGSCLEEAGGSSSLYVNPDDVEAMGAALNTFILDDEKRQRAITETRAYVHRFENTDVAKQVVSVYNKLMF
jgi:glycosyltransferase involved in cell wall biosynthesis